MPVRGDHTAWTTQEVHRLTVLSASGVSAEETAKRLNAEFHKGQPIRNETRVKNKRVKLGIKTNRDYTHKVPEAVGHTVTEQEVQRIENQQGIEARSNGARIKTVEDLLKHIDADLKRFEVAESQATKYEVASRDPASGKVTVTELHRVFVKLRPKAGPSIVEVVEAMIAGAVKPRVKIAAHKIKSKPNALQAVVLADPHIGKYAWGQETGWEDYDIGIATTLIRNASAELLAWGDNENVSHRALWLLGDILHYDTPHGTTTKGTPLDRDGRVDKMIEEAVSVLCDVIHSAAERGPLDVVLVPGNHDAVMTVALRHILSATFANDERVTIDAQKTTRKYVTFGNCLVGLTHGDKAQKRLGELMALEAREQWGTAKLREVHHGHRHSDAMVETAGGVTIRQHPALCPADGWHASEGYVGAPRAMDSYVYHADGYLLGMRRSTVR
jgi:hypothetical protein